MDSNGDGMLSRDELYACALALGKHLTEEDLDELFSITDPPHELMQYTERIDMARGAAETHELKQQLMAATPSSVSQSPDRSLTLSEGVEGLVTEDDTIRKVALSMQSSLTFIES
eukprot:SAG31_NODE_630_length_13427_cov_27.066327_4_plen_115_part_00